MKKYLLISLAGVLGALASIFFFQKTALAQSICGEWLTIDVFNYYWSDSQWKCVNDLVYWPTGSHDEPCSPTVNDCKTDRAVCADVSPRTCTPPTPDRDVMTPCSTSSYAQCFYAIERAECRDGYIYECVDYVIPGTPGSATCTAQRYDCWINWDPTATPGGPTATPGGPTATPGGPTPTNTPAPTPTLTPVPPPSCTINFFSPDPVNVAVGETQIVRVDITASRLIGRVDFSTVTPAIASIVPGYESDSSPFGGGWTTQVRGNIPGDTDLRASVYIQGVLTCGGAAPVDPVKVSDPAAWWQVIGGDVITNGSLFSRIPGSCSLLPPCNPAFIVNPAGWPATPGVPSYGVDITDNYDFSSGLGLGTVSSTGWIGKAGYNAATNYNYAFFERLVPGDTERSDENTITTPSINQNYLKTQGRASGDGYIWYFRTGDLTLSQQFLKTKLNDRKIILFVTGNLTINETIDLDPGTGFFMAIVGGNITVNSISAPAGQPELEGIFVTDGNFTTASDTEQLSVRGMVAAYGMVDPNRDLPDNSATPAESFEYAPDLLFNMPPSLQLKRTRWKEVAP